MSWQFFSSCIFFSAANSMGMSAHPEQVGKKQDDNESASRFKLLEEPGQKVPENKDFESVC